MAPDAIGSEQGDVGNVTDTILRIAQDAFLPSRLGVAFTRSVLVVEEVGVARAGGAGARAAASSSRQQETCSRAAVAEAAATVRYGEALDVID